MGCNTSQEKSTPVPVENGNDTAIGDNIICNSASIKKGLLKKLDEKVALIKESDEDDGGDNEQPNKQQPDRPVTSIIVNGIAAVDEFDDLDGQDVVEAATKIQAVFRGHQVRSSMKQGDTIANSMNGAKIQSDVTAAAATATAATATTVTVAAIGDEATAAGVEQSREELELEFDPNDKELCSAATRIQATFRGHLARKVASDGTVKDDLDLQEITKKVAEELDIDLSDPELNKAATKIQASFRGHRDRARKDDEPAVN